MIKRLDGMVSDRVIVAAIKVGSSVFTCHPPERHNHVIHLICQRLAVKRVPPSTIQGFCFDGDFLTREEAAEEAFDMELISKRKRQLFTEDLW